MIKDETGKRYGRLLVLERDMSIKSRQARWKCLCDCGEVVSVLGRYLRRGSTKSCGCLHDSYEYLKGRTTFGALYKEYPKIYRKWTFLKQKIFNPNNPQYKNYGAKGVTICKEWCSFDSFLQWALQNGYKEKYSLERIDTEKGFCPTNCRWTEKQRIIKNRRP